MASNLTTVAISTRKVIRYGVLFIVLTIIARMTLGYGLELYRAVAPKPTPRPTARFGPLPALPFPKPNQDLPALTINVETPTGKLPVLQSQAKIYYMPPYSTNLASFDSSVEKAAKLGFSGEPLKISESLYRFTAKDLPSTLEINIVTGAFSISFNLAANSTPLTQVPPAPEVAASTAKQLLSAAATLPEDIKEGDSSHEFLKVEGQNLVRALSLSEANFVRVNLFRKKLDELPSVTADPNQGTIWFIVSGASEQGKKVIAAQYRYFPIEEKKFETYPLKSISDALEELKAGGGHIANLGINKDGKVTIRSISLAYYDSEVAMDYYQPVYVFKGDRDFTAYVPAVSRDFYGKN